MYTRSKITIDPEICHGKPVITGTRILVGNILGALASGETIEDVLEDYPNLKKEDIYEALAFGGELCNFENLPYGTQAS